jgi:putative membrane protein
MQVEDHQAAVDLFQAEATSGTNPALKSLAQQVLPTLQTHLQQAQVIAGTGDTTGDASSAAVTPVQIPPDTASATGAATSGADDATGGALGQDASFVQKAAADGLLEISEGNLMVQRIGTDNSVGEFGLWMASDHAALSATLKALAAAEGIAVPTSLPADLQQDVTALGSVSEQDLPGTYMTWQVIGHADSVMQFLDEAENGQSAVLQAFAQNALPILGHHLQEAAELYREHGGQLSDIGMNDTQLSDLIRAALGDDQAGLAADMTSGSAWVDATSMPDQAAAQSDQGAFFPTSLGASMNPADVMALQNA